VSVAAARQRWYARLVTSIPVLGEQIAAPWFRVLSVAAPSGPGSAEQDFLAILPAAASAARGRRPFVAGWLCRAAGSPLEFVTNAVLAGPDHGGHTGQDALLFPAGARGVPAPADWLAACDKLVWAPCPGRQAPPLAGPQSAHEDHQPTRFESALTAVLGRPFGWLVVAEPTDRLDAEVAELRAQVTVLRQHDEERFRFEADLAERRLAELDAFREAGLWTVRVLAGAATPGELALIAPVLAGAADLSHHPYRLGSAQAAQSLAEALAPDPGPGAGPGVPFDATAGVLTALAGLPRREVPGLRVLDTGYFDLTSETERRAGADGEPVTLGTILDAGDQPAGEFRVPLPTLNRHTLVTGATGAGKSHTVRHLLAQLTRAGLPWLVIEPAKCEYSAGLGGAVGPGLALGGVVGSGLALSGLAGAFGSPATVLNPADPEAIPVSVNPLAPEPGYPVQAHIDMLRALFLAAFDAEEPFPQIIAQALQQVYEANGWDVVTGGRVPGAVAEPAVPTLAQLERAALAVISDVGYGRELQADVRGFVGVRLRSLRIGSAGRFFEGGHPADIAGLLRRNVVLAIEDVANDEDKAFLMGTLIIKIVEHLRLRARAGQAGGLRHVIVIEEAHRLLRARQQGRASAHAVELFAGLLAEIRAYGEGLVIAEQIPAKLIPDAVKNTALKVMHRLPAADDRELVGATMNLGEDQSRQVVSLEPGVAAVFADGMDRPIRVRVPLSGGEPAAPDAPGLAGEPAVDSGPAVAAAPPVLGCRSVACGPLCTGVRPCTLREMRAADLLAAPGSPADAWLRVWVETLVLAFLTGRGLPVVPARLRQRWDELGERVRDCLLATVIDRAVAARAAALRASYDPAQLAASAARVAVRALGQGAGPGTRIGPSWVIPQLRWLHELERICPAGGAPDPAESAPPLDFDLPGLADWPGSLVGHRLRALRRHPLSMELAHNRMPAWTALLGEDDQHAFSNDLATLGVGLRPGEQLGYAAALMNVAPWLEVVLSWPGRFVASPAGRSADGGEAS
jgi:helicase HerA-like protein